MRYVLQVLSRETYRQQVILAELVGLLHNIGKLDPNFLPNQVKDTSDAIAEIRNHGQFVNGYQFKRVTQPSSDLLSPLVRPLIASSTKLDVSQLPSVNADELGQSQRNAAESFNRFFRGVGPVDGATASRLRALKLFIAREEWTLPDLLTLFWDKEFVYKTNGDDYQRQYALAHWLVQKRSTLPLLLALAHGEMSGSEKYPMEEDPATGNLVAKRVRQQKNRFEELRISSPFGYEPVGRIDAWSWQNRRNDLLARLPDKSAELASKRDSWLNLLEDTLSLGLGDTQWPVNEITLWDYASSVATLFKASVAKSLVEGQVADANTMHWRLLGVRMDGLDYRFQTSRLADLIARNEIIQAAYNAIQKTLEERTPVGNEVYRDEHGSYFLVPEIAGMSSSDWQQQISILIQQVLEEQNIDDIWPVVIASDPLRGKQLNLGTAIEHLGDPAPSAVPANLMANWWKEQTDVCVVCHQRPQGYVPATLQDEVSASLARKRNLCGVCLWRRQGRARKWFIKERTHRTIWIDEVADAYGRFALIAAGFDIEHWLNGELIETLALGEDETTSKPVPKFASFPRVRRMWRTTKQFWQDIERELQAQKDGQHGHRLRDGRRRLALELSSIPDALEDLHVYELNLGKISLSVIWDASQKRLISVDNLSYIASQMEIVSSETSAVDAALEVGVWIEEYKNSFVLIEPPEAGTTRRDWRVQVTDVDYEDTAYAPVIPILAEPRTFMALVPANKAIEVVKAIKTKYEREMGKVRNRLPLHLGVVYGGRRTPLASVLDAGQCMLKQTASTEGWQVTDVRKQPADGGGLPERFQQDAQGQFAQWYEIGLEKDGRQFTWYVPAVMGDGQTEDAWYPYVFLDVEAEPTDRQRRFQAPNPFSPNTEGEPQPGWLVHAGKLKEDDMIYFTPSTFDFEYLDASARRFEVAYGKDDGRRLGNDKKQRPYLLEEVDALEKTWEGIRQLSTSQIKALETLIESKRQDWNEPTGMEANASDIFRQFVADALRTANVYSEGMLHAALTGMLADALEIHMTIHKEKTTKDSSQEETTHD